MTPARVTLYTTPGCSACAAIEKYLVNRGVDFETKDVSGNEANLAEMQRAAGVRIAPVTVIDGTAYYGDLERQRPHLEAAFAHPEGKEEP